MCWSSVGPFHAGVTMGVICVTFPVIERFYFRGKTRSSKIDIRTKCVGRSSVGFWLSRICYMRQSMSPARGSTGSKERFESISNFQTMGAWARLFADLERLRWNAKESGLIWDTPKRLFFPELWSPKLLNGGRIKYNAGTSPDVNFPPLVKSFLNHLLLSFTRKRPTLWKWIHLASIYIHLGLEITTSPMYDIQFFLAPIQTKAENYSIWICLPFRLRIGEKSWSKGLGYGMIC